MKNLTIFLLFTFCLTACQQPPEPPKQEAATVDKQAIEKVAGDLMDRFYQANKPDNFSDLNNIMADDGILLGTDPSEVLDKATMLKTLESYKQDSVMSAMMANLTFDVKKRDFSVADDGSQVIVTDVTQASFSKLPIRSTAIMKKYDGNWKIFYTSNGFLIKNDDLAKVDAIF
ncbi:MAG: nuclear transport factor 2 family protein [Lewinellaceae bacterium]|nr:nuclear transport factor 2 family protein [Saprospiraceae bacterium]MCB9336656.1 nuclear transport factor 2 family protein [Lewinellaceae bacterium]